LSSVVVAGGEKEDRNLGAALGQTLGDLEAVEVGQHYVEDDDVGAEVLGALQRLLSVGRLLDREVLVAQGHRQHVGDVLVVVDDEGANLVLVGRRLASGHTPIIVTEAGSFLRNSRRALCRPGRQPPGGV